MGWLASLGSVSRIIGALWAGYERGGEGEERREGRRGKE